MLPELRPPARTPERSPPPQGWLLAGILSLLLVAGLYALHRVRLAAPAVETEQGIPVPPPIADAPTPSPQAAEPKPAMDCGYVNGVETCVPRMRERSSGAEPDAAERARRALAIMAETRRSMQVPSPDSRPVPRRNERLAAAERQCLKHKEGTVAYRQCRGDVWQGLRRQCIDERARDIYDGDHCDAERRFIIPD